MTSPVSGLSSFTPDRRQAALISRRIQSLYVAAQEPCIVMDIGTDFLRAGLSGEHAPRCILHMNATSMAQVTTEDPRTRESSIKLLHDDFLGELEDRIELAVREAVNRFLYLSPKGKRVVILESHYLPIKVKKIMARVLFTYQQPREISFMPASVCALMAIQRTAGIYIDLGSNETLVVPIFDLRTINNLVRSTNLAASALKTRVTYLLQRYSSPRLGQMTTLDVDDFVATALVCLPRSPLPPDSSDFVLHADLEASYAVTMHRGKSFSWTQPSTRNVVSLPVWIRYAATEIFFEPRDVYADSSSRSIVDCVVSSYRASSIDTKPHLKEFVVTGGLSLIPGLVARLARETGLKPIKNEFGAELGWAGASLAASMRMEGSILGLQQFNSSGKVPDWSQRLDPA